MEWLNGSHQGDPALPDAPRRSVGMACSSPLSVSYLFLKFFELWSRFLRNDLKRKNVLLLAAKPTGLRGAYWRIMTPEAEKWHCQLANICN